MPLSNPSQFAGLYGPFIKKLQRLEQDLVQEGLNFYLFMGLRTFQQQDALYAEGRTRPGPPCFHNGHSYPIGTCRVHPFGLTVTKAKGGQSWHNYGLAADYVLDLAKGKIGLRLSWDTSTDDNGDHIPDYQNLGTIAMVDGFTWGGSWRTIRDYPHVEDTYGLDLLEAIELHRQGGIGRVWAECNKVIHASASLNSVQAAPPTVAPVSAPEADPADIRPTSSDAATGPEGAKNE